MLALDVLLGLTTNIFLIEAGMQVWCCVLRVMARVDASVGCILGSYNEYIRYGLRSDFRVACPFLDNRPSSTSPFHTH